MHKLRQWWQVVKLYFPKYIDKVVIIEKTDVSVIQFGYTMKIFQYVFICFKNIFGFRHCLDLRNGALEMVCRDNHDITEQLLIWHWTSTIVLAHMGVIVSQITTIDKLEFVTFKKYLYISDVSPLIILIAQIDKNGQKSRKKNTSLDEDTINYQLSDYMDGPF